MRQFQPILGYILHLMGQISKTKEKAQQETVTHIEIVLIALLKQSIWPPYS